MEISAWRHSDCYYKVIGIKPSSLLVLKVWIRLDGDLEKSPKTIH